MLPVFGENEHKVLHVLKLNGFNQTYSVKKKIKETSLYSVYLLSVKKKTLTRDEVLLIEHPPAKESSAHILPININELGTTTETIQKIAEAVYAHFARNPYWFR